MAGSDVLTKMGETNIIWVERCEYRDEAVRPHTHSYCQLYYGCSGDCTLVLGDSEYTLSEGYGIFAAPDIPHGIKHVENGAVVTKEIKFSVEDEDLISDLDRFEGPIAFDSYASGIVDYITDYGRSRLDYYQKSCRCFLDSLIYYLSRKNRGISRADSNSQLIDTSGFSDLTIKMIIFLEENYASKISLELLAEKMGYSKNYICFVFKKDTGFTIIDYLNFVRIRHAAEMFSYSDNEISHICKDVGFVNMSHFNHTFKRFVGIPPGVYRRMFPADIYKSMSDDKIFPMLISDQVQMIAHLFGTLPDDAKKR